MMMRMGWLVVAGMVAAGPVNAQDVPTSSESAAVSPAGAVDTNEWFARAARAERRPTALPILYVSFGAMQALDVSSTTRALEAGAREQNPLLARFGGHLGATLAVKAATGVATVFVAERLWKTNRVGAIAVMVAANGVTAAVAAHNMRVARAQTAR